jgi:uncharacterized protein Smg (DUF494 family)
MAALESINKERDSLESHLLATKFEVKDINAKLQKLEQLKKEKEAKYFEVVARLKDKNKKKKSLESVLEAFKE